MSDESLLAQATHAATKAALDQVAKDRENNARVDVSLDGIEASVERKWSNGWGITAYVRRLWRGGTTEAGARIDRQW